MCDSYIDEGVKLISQSERWFSLLLRVSVPNPEIWPTHTRTLKPHSKSSFSSAQLTLGHQVTRCFPQHSESTRATRGEPCSSKLTWIWKRCVPRHGLWDFFIDYNLGASAPSEDGQISAVSSAAVLTGGKNEMDLVSFCCWLIVSSLSTSLQASQTLRCSAANILQGCCKACFFSLHVFLHNGGSLVGQNRTNHRWSRAESPCAWAGIQEDTLPTANHHLNNVSQFIRGWTAPVCKLLDATFVVKYLIQQWIFPTFYSSSLIPVEEFASHISSLLRLLPSVTAVVLLFVFVLFLIYDGWSFLFCHCFTESHTSDDERVLIRHCFANKWGIFDNHAKYQSRN